ncbi:MAG: DUF418 domain-containing protein [Rubripirellula sp.]
MNQAVISTEAQASATPTTTPERLFGLDVLRGFALCGVSLVNAWLSARPMSEAFAFPKPDTGTSSWLDAVAWSVFDGLLVTKFVTLFSLLFGIGLVLQNQRAEANGLPFSKIYRRRLAILAGLGIVHGFVLFEGDILFLYAIVGAILFGFRNQSPQVLLWLSAIPFTIGVILSLLWAGFDLENLLMSAKIDAGEIESPRPQTVLEVLMIRPVDFIGWLVVSSFMSFNWRVVSFFFLGAAIMKNGWIRPHHVERQRRAAVIGLAVGLSIELVGVWLATFDEPSLGIRLGRALCDEFGSIILSVGYAGSILWFVHAGHLQSRFLQPLSRGLAAVGRTALTNYLLQSVVMNIVFMDFLLGYYNRLSPIEVLIVFTTLFAIQIIASTAWLNRFKMGPVEWFWRTLTYRGIPSAKAR